MKKFLAVLVKAIIFFIGGVVLAGVIPVPDAADPAIWRFWAELIPLAIIAVFTLIFWLIEKRSINLLIFRNLPKGIIIGIVTGIIWLGGSFGILYLMGIASYSGSNHINKLWLWFIAAFLNTIMQELLVRGYLYQLVKKQYNLPIAAIISTVLFTIMHGGAFEAGFLPVLNVVTMSLLATAMLEYAESLAAPIMAHFVWNSIGCMILGAVSLADDYPHLLNMNFTGNALLSGGSCKLEGSIIVLIFNVVLCSVFLLLIRRKTNQKFV